MVDNFDMFFKIQFYVRSLLRCQFISDFFLFRTSKKVKKVFDISVKKNVTILLGLPRSSRSKATITITITERETITNWNYSTTFS
jgi:hypothetical protein